VKKTDYFPSCLADYFSNNEFSEALKEAAKPIPVKKAKVAEVQESDSEPSCDNFEDGADIFDEALSEDEKVVIAAEKPAKKKLSPIKLRETSPKKKKEVGLKVVIEESTPKVKEQTIPERRVEPSKSEQVIENNLNLNFVNIGRGKNIEEITQQISSIEDYKMLAEKIIEVKNETKKLNEKFQRLEKEINDQSSLSYL